MYIISDSTENPKKKFPNSEMNFFPFLKTFLGIQKEFAFISSFLNPFSDTKGILITGNEFY